MNADYAAGLEHLQRALELYEQALEIEPSDVGLRLTTFTIRRSIIMHTAYSGEIEEAFAYGEPLLEEVTALAEEHPRHMGDSTGTRRPTLTSVGRSERGRTIRRGDRVQRRGD